MSVIDKIKKKFRVETAIGTVLAIVAVLIIMPILIGVALLIPFGVIYGLDYLFKWDLTLLQMLVGALVILGLVAIFKK